MFPVIFFPSILTLESGVAEHVLMSDILFMSVKEHAGKKVQADGMASTVANICTLTASTGKDLYLAEAQINCKSTGVGGTTNVTVVLKANGIVIETFSVNLAGQSTSEGEYSKIYTFAEKGEKVTATQSFTLDITSVTDVTVSGHLLGFQETTGESPFQTSEFS